MMIFKQMQAALLAVSEQSDMGPGKSGDTVVPGFIMQEVREALAASFRNDERISDLLEAPDYKPLGNVD